MVDNVTQSSEAGLGDEALLRYSRHILMPQIDIAGQLAIVQAKVLVLGLGGLGSPVALYLAASGVGCLRLVDDDEVDLSNLQRQIIHRTDNIGLAKVDSAAKSIEAINNQAQLILENTRPSAEQLQTWVAEADVVVDCSDNFATRSLLNKLCFQQKKPLVSGAAIRFEGQLTSFDFRHEQSPCYACLYGVLSEQNLSCSENGVLSPLVGLIGSAQAIEALKYIANFGKTLEGRLQLFDASSANWKEFSYRKDENCEVCSCS